MMQKVVVFLVLVCLVAEKTEAACSPVNASYDLCAVDATCRASMYLDENEGDWEVFVFLWEQMTAREGLRDRVEARLCEDNATEAYEELWTDYMADFHYCRDINKYFDGVVRACLCRTDRNCRYTPPREQEFHFASYGIFTLVMLLGIGLMMFFSNHEARRLFSLLKNDIKLGESHLLH